MQTADPGAERLASVLGVSEVSVQLYAPLLLPLGLELGGFIFLAAGLAPAARRREDVATQTVAAILAEAVATPPKRGTREYYLHRLQRDHPAIAARVTAGEISVYKACVEAGIRKAPAKASKWTKADAYMKPAGVTA